MWRDSDTLRYLYKEKGYSIIECADLIGCGKSNVGNWLRKHGIESRKGAESRARCELSLSDYQHELVTGILMSDGCLMTRNSVPSLQVRMITKPFLEWLDEEFGELSTGVRLVSTAEEKAKSHRRSGFNLEADSSDYSDIFGLITRSLPGLCRYEEWYSSGRKVWPSNIELTPTVLKMFYCGDGNMKEDSRVRGNRRPCIRFRADNEIGNKEKVLSMFERSGFDVRWPGDDIYVPVRESERMWEYMGSPPPGFEYKWPKEMGNR